MKTERPMQQSYCQYRLSCKRKDKAASGVVLPINTEAVKQESLQSQFSVWPIWATVGNATQTTYTYSLW